MPKQDRMGNLLFITGKGIKEEMAQYFSPDPDNNGEIIFDFNKVIPVEDIENEQECLEKWGTIRNSSDTQFHAVGEEKPRNLTDRLYFNSHDKVPKVIQRLAELHPDWEIEYEYAEEWAESAGRFEKEDDGTWYETKHDYRSSEAIETFCEIWGRSEDFEWCSQLSRYVGVDEKASTRLLPRVEKDYYEYYKREVEESSNEMLFEHSWKNHFIYQLKNYLLEMPENEGFAEALLKTRGNLFDSLYNYKMCVLGTSDEQDGLSDFCDDWFGTYKQAQAECEM